MPSQCDAIERLSRRIPTFLHDYVDRNSVASIFQRRTIFDVDELSFAIPDWSIEISPLRPGSFRGEITVVTLGPVLIWYGRYNQQLLERVRTPEHCMTIAHPSRGPDVVTFNGRALRDGEVLLGGCASVAETVGHGVREPAAASVRLDFLRSQSDWLEAHCPEPAAQMQVRSAGSTWTQEFSAALRWISDAVVRYEGALTHAEVQRSLVDALLARISCVHLMQAPLSEHRGARASRRIAVQRAREYIHSHLTDPIRLSELCEHAHTQARSLEYGFLEVMGVSPMTYVRALRLQRVRRLLLSPAVHTRSVSEIALDCGFWHLGQFAADYKQHYSESPSATYRRTRGRMLERLEFEDCAIE